MKNISFDELNQEQIVDLRSKEEVSETFFPDSLALTEANYEKYGANLIDNGKAVVFLVASGDQPSQGLENAVPSLTVHGYIQTDQIPENQFKKLPTITPASFFEIEKDYILLDLRHPDEITRPAPTKNLVNIPIQDLSKNLQNLDQSKPVYTLCGSGGRATLGASYLDNQGFDVSVIEGGMKAVQEEEAYQAD